MIKTYKKATTLKEALELLDKNNLKIISGGTDLVVRIKHNESNNEGIKLLDIHDLTELKSIKENSDHISIGSNITYTNLIESNIIKTKLSLLVETAKEVASPPIRSRGTIGGNIANASPAGDIIPALFVLDAKLRIISKDNEKLIQIVDFFTGPGKNILKSNELIFDIQIPITQEALDSKCIYFFRKLGQRKAQAISKVSCAFFAEIDNQHIVKNCKIAFGAVAPTVIYGKKVQEYLIGKKLSPEVISEVSNIAMNEISPIDDIRSNKNYRKQALRGILIEKLSSYK